MSVSQYEERRPVAVAVVSMRELLASCAAADAVSRPPRMPEPVAAPAGRGRAEQGRKAA
ncbi:hypothetical protein ABZ619_34950 [Streptomyces sp. NPDC007851]|uniref:hypothetical protein n=1 Tax=Streptomyces sp. NPDC007851 TaxID=3155008 RepID=UPI0033E757A8